MVDLITIVFQQELVYLKLQAKSIDLYIDSNLVNKIYVVINDKNHLIDQIDTAWWGKFCDRVIVYHYSEFNYSHSVNGWENQQLCKLLAASRCESEWSLILDAKTFFVNNCNKNLLFNKNRARTNHLYPMEVFRSAQSFIESLFKIQIDKIIGPGGVPYLFHTNTIKACIKDVEKISNTSFIEFFLKNVKYPNLITEFYLYSGYVKFYYGHYNTLYIEDQEWQCINIADWEVANFDHLLIAMQFKETITVSVHRRTFKLLSNEQQLSYLNFLKDKGLLLDPQSIQNHINTVSFD